MNIDKPEAKKTDQTTEEETPDGSILNKLEISDDILLVRDNYYGFRAWFSTNNELSRKTLSSSACPIGTKLKITSSEDEDVVVQLSSGETLGTLDKKGAEKILELQQKQWEIHAILSLVVWQNNAQNNLGEFLGEISFVCYNPKNPKVSIAMLGFLKGIISRIKGGDHPLTNLTQGQFEKVIESQGDWYLTHQAPLPKKDENKIIFKRRQNFTDKLIDLSIEHRIGCSIISILIFIVIIAAIIALVIIL